ncbi:mannitol-1-phosphate 5-dehydrogenase [Pontibacillus yanchengensis]|uniref:Mannitol-1-phosphate 5-dehydrogenase n=2 Tax=Pontibacillus yanchengensis TaxID=462910 RepID=A0ACC7VBS6_9BACI|nr:mannitol-1-phosphate 5-dehydrogenase [Pontibacillus yanchengensis]MYL35377.1 mannitol-1-phosphate 5-dehydrogenase [Pontibacillus yanchengensis]MYL52406.1 mannitol-1-phosphate 5-dehydrogenase [Pontibacillus yanchengensis]
MRAVHFGAGNIGRGFIGELLYESDYETIFVDVNEALIDQLNERRSYTVELAGSDEKIDVNNVSGLNSMSQTEAVVDAIVDADIITTAVGPHILPAISKVIAQGLQKRLEKGKAPINIIACENMIGGSEKLKGYILGHITDQQEAFEQNVGFPNAAVDRIVPDQNNDDSLTVKVEPYYEWIVETSDIKGEKPPVHGIKYVADLTPFIERKLFTVNTGHAGAAYLGRYHGHQTIKQAMDNPSIVEKVRAALHESGAVLIEKYNFSRSEHHEYIEKIIERFLNPDLSDEVTRVGRAPKRKLGSNDRLIRPTLEYIKWVGKDPENLSEIIAAALLYQDDNDEEASALHQSVQEKGALETLKDIAELEDDSRLIQAVETRLNEMK